MANTDALFVTSDSRPGKGFFILALESFTDRMGFFVALELEGAFTHHHSINGDRINGFCSSLRNA